MRKTPGQILLEKRVAAGLSQEELGTLAGCKRARISKLEKGGDEISAAFAKRIAPHLGVKPYELLGDLGYDTAFNLDKLNAEARKAAEDFYNYLLGKQGSSA